MSVSAATGLAITNPLVKYRTLVATGSISPNNGQLRLALHLQKLYERLKDYEPQVEYGRRLEQISRAVESHDDSHESSDALQPSSGTYSSFRRGAWRTLLERKQKRDSLALTRRLTSHESAIHLSSPRGLMVHGEVGTGKSMLIDIFADCLPNRKKRRWHFNTFMLEVIAKLEMFRQERSQIKSPLPSSLPHEGHDEDNYSLLWLARDMIQNNPILFLDEFQMPDRVASKILTNLMTSFFHLGGVLIATSNRMPEELAKASGIEFTPPPSRLESLGWRFGGRSQSNSGGAGLYYGQNEFVAFLEVLKARCEVWEMEGGVDYRRVESGQTTASRVRRTSQSQIESISDLPGEDCMTEKLDPDIEREGDLDAAPPDAPAYYQLASSASTQLQQNAYTTVLDEIAKSTSTGTISFKPETVSVYGRAVIVPRAHEGTTEWTFSELCKQIFGPADYITLASTYHTFIIRDVPILTWLMKNEARRFITLLDALYECRCKLYIVNAATGPDELFFPDQDEKVDVDDAVYSETISEVYQDATAPFRPNILMQNPNYAEPDPEPDYTHARLAGVLNADSLEDEPPLRSTQNRSSPGQRHPFGRSHGPTNAESDRRPIDPDESRYTRNPDFGKTSAFTGEDEMFAYRRAQSRLWELCGTRWWDRTEPGWHRPLPRDTRRWEGNHNEDHNAVSFPLGRRPVKSDGTSDVRIGDARIVDDGRNEALFRDGASPFRKDLEAPPKFGWQHMWGLMRWGKKAGPWGQGVEGLNERRKGER